MKFKVLTLLALLAMLLGMTVCGKPVEPSSQELRVRTDDVTLHVRVAGGPEAEDVLIAVGMGPGVSSRYMASLEQLASREFVVVTYDQRGTGRSTEPSDGYALFEYVADLEAVREAIGAERVYLMGHCWGGLVAMRYATVYPQRVRSIVLWGSAPPSWHVADAAQARKDQRFAELQQQGIIPATLLGVEQILPVFLSDPSFELPDELRDLQYSATVEQDTMSAVGEYDITTEVGSLNHPVLLLWGEDDPFGLPTAEATRNALSAAQVEFVVLGQCGHLWQECPGEFFSLVRAFLGLPPAP